MIAKLLICYAVSILLTVGGTVALAFYFKKKVGRFSVPAFLGGILAFFAVLALLMMFVLYAFSKESTMYMTAFMSEAIYKIVAAILFLVVIGIIRYFALGAAFFSRDKEVQGTAFLAGFGMAGAYLVAFYCLVSFAYVAYISSHIPLLTLNLESALLFADNTVISVFTPFEAHIYVTAVFLIYTVLMLITARFMTQHANLPYKWSHTLIMYLLTAFCEVCMSAMLLFAISKLSYIAVVIIAVVLAAVAGVSVKLLYKYKEELPYERQFED